MAENRSIHPHALPNYERAEIPREKLEGYALNPTHPKEGQHKARVFKSALGFAQSDWELLRRAIIAELPYHAAVPRQEDKYGKRYEVILPMTGENLKVVDVTTSWIIKSGTDFPFLTTVYLE